MPVDFVGGALSFKGDKKKPNKKKKHRVKHDLKSGNDAPIEKLETEITPSDNLTTAERKAMKRRLERERIEAEKIAEKSHRERVEEFNQKLASLTELNDIPRVSAAGNG